MFACTCVYVCVCDMPHHGVELFALQTKRIKYNKLNANILYENISFAPQKIIIYFIYIGNSGWMYQYT